MVVQHNLSAMNANRYLGINNSKLSKSLEKLSSGYAINRAGDNAAGLAVSEKMRSQIAGMTQAVKNAQDGISMVQTFEGALTETDSILQRMKTLADQMANGTYDDPVDRTAAQQEFLQLNDELDQIADTDFNGVIVLNGGVMSDGLKAVDGEFNYKNAATAGAADAAVDIFDEETQNVLDNSGYNKDVADAIWEKLGLDSSKISDIEVTFTYDGENWVGSAVVDKTTGSATNGKVLDKADASQITTSQDAGKGTGEGGFVIKTDKGDMAAVFDEMVLDKKGNNRKVAEGDTVTFHFQNNADSTYAPKNAGIKESTLTAEDPVKAAKPAPKFTLDASLTDAKMDDDVKAALDAIKGTTFTLTYTDGATAGITDPADANFTMTAGTKDANGNQTYTLASAGGVTIGTISINEANITKETSPTAHSVNVTTTSPGSGNFALSGTADADTIKALLDAAGYDTTADVNVMLTRQNAMGTPANGWSDGNTWQIASDAALSADLGMTVDNASAATDTVVIAYTAATAGGAGDDPDADGDITFEIDVDSYKVKADAKLVAETVATSDAAKAAAAGGFEVSKSDAFKNSEAIMTYKESIILQAGARTKDAVEFTFKYDSKAIGDLKADLNCTAKGLGTDKLNLSSQKAANYAIDKIDQAINKVSLVRGTFGAIQNRLEHKIDNLNVSVENLTSAESQIRDTNMPQEMMNFTKQQILAQASQSMLAQANQLPQGVLSLLQ